ncbi:MAG: hypothetical protein AAF502_19490 [Bacteroidota bacterium]
MKKSVFVLIVLLLLLICPTLSNLLCHVSTVKATTKLGVTITDKANSPIEGARVYADRKRADSETNERGKSIVSICFKCSWLIGCGCSNTDINFLIVSPDGKEFTTKERIDGSWLRRNDEPWHFIKIE